MGWMSGWEYQGDGQRKLFADINDEDGPHSETWRVIRKAVLCFAGDVHTGRSSVWPGHGGRTRWVRCMLIVGSDNGQGPKPGPGNARRWGRWCGEESFYSLSDVQYVWACV